MKFILSYLKQFDVTAIIDDGKTLYVENLNGYRVNDEKKGNNFVLKKVDGLESFVTFEISKILTSRVLEYMKEFLKR